MTGPDADTIRAEFAESVTLTAGEREQWLATHESQSVGQATGGSGESTGLDPLKAAGR